MLNYPEDWKQKPLGKCVDIYQGGTPKTSTASFWGGKIVWLTPGEITKIEGLYVDNSERKITEQGLNNSSACLLPEGAILLCTRATIGDLAIAKVPLATNQGFKNLVCHGDIDNVFLSYLLRTKKEEMIGRAIGTTFLEISKKELSKIIIAFPEFQEQRAIAEALTSVDTHIANLTELIEKKKAIRDGALEELVSGCVRLEGQTISWVDTELGELAIYRKDNDSGTKDRYISTENINQGYNGIQRYSSRDAVEGHAFYKTDTLISNIRPYLRKVWYAEFSGICSLDVLVLQPKSVVDPKYLYYLVANDRFINFVMNGGIKGIKMPRGDKKYMLKYPVRIPSKKTVQKELAQMITSMDDEIASLEAELDKMQQIKAGMMSDLLTGHVRLIG